MPAIRRLARAVPTAAALSVLAACSDPATAPVEGAPTHDLVVVARVHGFDELFTVPLAGGAPQQLFAAQVNAWHPAPSPDGSRIAYVDLGDDEIWVADRDGSDRHNVSQYLADIDVSPSWSPDGARLVFSSSRSGGMDIYVVNADGSGLTNLMPNDYPAAPMDLAPAWSPDGTRIAFSSDRDSYPVRHIWTMRADGTQLTRVTSGTGVSDNEPAWSPDGKRIVFRRDRATGGALDADLAIVNADGSNLVELRQPGRERSPTWSPDGAWIAFTSDRVNAEYRLFTIRPDGSEVVERAGGLAFGRQIASPRWMRRR